MEYSYGTRFDEEVRDVEVGLRINIRYARSVKDVKAMVTSVLKQWRRCEQHGSWHAGAFRSAGPPAPTAAGWSRRGGAADAGGPLPDGAVT